MTVEPRAYYRRVPVDEFSDVVDSFAKNLSYVLYERPDDIRLVPYAPPDSTWKRGRAFGKTLEIRWAQADDVCELQLLTETDRVPAGWDVIPLDDIGGQTDNVEAVSTQMLLWGTHRRELPSTHRLKDQETVANEWIETRIPRPLHYPVDGQPKHVVLEAMTYCVGGRPVLTRLVAVEPYKQRENRNDDTTGITG